MKKVIFDLPSFSVVYTLVKRKLNKCEYCKGKDKEFCTYNDLLRALESLNNSVYYEEESKKNKDELP